MSLHEDVAINPWVRYLNAYGGARVYNVATAVQKPSGLPYALISV
jgi:hypothetical protein